VYFETEVPTCRESRCHRFQGRRVGVILLSWRQRQQIPEKQWSIYQTARSRVPEDHNFMNTSIWFCHIFRAGIEQDTLGYVRVHTSSTCLKLLWTLMFRYVTIMKDSVSSFMVYCWLSSQRIGLCAVVLEVSTTGV